MSQYPKVSFSCWERLAKSRGQRLAEQKVCLKKKQPSSASPLGRGAYHFHGGGLPCSGVPAGGTKVESVTNLFVSGFGGKAVEALRQIELLVTFDHGSCGGGVHQPGAKGSLGAKSDCGRRRRSVRRHAKRWNIEGRLRRHRPPEYLESLPDRLPAASCAAITIGA